MNILTKHIITIAGRPGSGKSSTAKGVAEKLNFAHFSSGDLFREVSKQQGVDILELNQAAEKQKGISYVDELVDKRLRDIGKNQDNIVIDSRMAWHWIPASFKVFLDLDLKTAAERILKNITPERMEAEKIPNDIAEYSSVLQERLDSESRRYKSLYNADPYSMDNYDLVIDTLNNSLDQVIDMIIREYEKRNKS